jgi:prepilin-type N-terminal cleavage/methylation domain-containing protein/prepilin-type processing-associated H-X9-DG protein
MKPRLSSQRNHALTLVEVLVVIVIIAFLAVILLPALTHHSTRKPTICSENLKYVGLAFHVWAGDNGGKYPMEVSITNGGAMESAATGNIVAIFQAISNELSTPKILICPADTKQFSVNFSTDFSTKNISYFVGLDVNVKNPQAMVSGDDNFEIAGVPVKSGLLELFSNTPIAWSAARHEFTGNIALADGSVQGVNNSTLTNWLHQTGIATNRLAIP